MEARSFDDVVDVRNGLLLQEEVMNEDEDALDTFEGEGGRKALEEEKKKGKPATFDDTDVAAIGVFVAEGGRDDGNDT